MKQLFIKALSLYLFLTLIAGALLPVYAAPAPKLITGSGVLWVGSGRTPVVASDLPEDAGSFSVASSNKSVLKVGKQKGFGPYGWWMEPLKAGKAKITLKYKTGGKIQKVSGTFKVRKYPAPFAYIKINGKKVNLKKDFCNVFLQSYTGKTVTVSFKLKSDWRATLGGSRIKNGDWIDVKWKNGKALSLKGYEAADLIIDLKNTKTGVTCNYEIIISR